jgi:CHAD domain-containing protein
MTAFRLKRTESEDEGIRRVARGLIRDTVELLRDDDADPVEAVHEARKNMKKMRSTLKLVRPVIGDDLYRRENERFRDAARALSEVRDAQVRAGTVDGLAEHFADDPPPAGWGEVRAAISPEERSGNDDLEVVRKRAAAEIERGDREVDGWPLDTGGFALLRPGLKRAYSRGRRRYREVRAHSSDEVLHEWRKRSKDFWYQLRLIRNSWKTVLGATADEAHELSDRLGDDHDLVMLHGYLKNADERLLTREQCAHIERLIGDRRKDLQEEAFGYGDRLFAEKPKRFVERIESYWAADWL